MHALTRMLGMGIASALFAVLFTAMPAQAQPPIGSDSYTAKIYHVNYGFYPIVEAYIRTWDTNQEPLVNLNVANIGLQVKGRNYDPRTAIPANQYSIESIERRREGFRTVIVLDCSGSMRGEPFTHAIDAINRFIEAKRPVDQIAIIAIRDTSTGYEVVSEFTNNPQDLYRRLSDVRPDGQQTRLYDSVAAALQMCATAFPGDAARLDYAVLSTVVILSDGYDEGSALSRSELINRIGTMSTPIPIHSIAFSRIDRSHLLNMEAISTASFGRYFGIESTGELARTMEHVHRINRSDYVVTFRSYVPVDGESHNFRVGVEYPTGSGTVLFSSGSFEAIESPASFNPATAARLEELTTRYPDNEPAAIGSGAVGSLPHDERPSREPFEVSAAPGDERPPREPFEVASADPVDPAPSEAAPATDTAVEPAQNDEDEQDIVAVLQANAPLFGAAVVLLFVLVLAIVWVKKSSRVETPPSHGSPRRTADPPRTTNSGQPAAEAATRTTGDDWNN